MIEEKEYKDPLVIQTQMDGKGKAIKELLNKLMIAIEDNGTYHLRLDIFEQKQRQKQITDLNKEKPMIYDFGIKVVQPKAEYEIKGV